MIKRYLGLIGFGIVLNLNTVALHSSPVADADNSVTIAPLSTKPQSTLSPTTIPTSRNLPIANADSSIITTSTTTASAYTIPQSTQSSINNTANSYVTNAQKYKNFPANFLTKLTDQQTNVNNTLSATYSSSTTRDQAINDAKAINTQMANYYRIGTIVADAANLVAQAQNYTNFSPTTLTTLTTNQTALNDLATPTLSTTLGTTTLNTLNTKITEMRNIYTAGTAVADAANMIAQAQSYTDFPQATLTRLTTNQATINTAATSTTPNISTLNITMGQMRSTYQSGITTMINKLITEARNYKNFPTAVSTQLAASQRTIGSIATTSPETWPTNFNSMKTTFAQMQTDYATGKTIADLITQMKTSATTANELITKSQNYPNFPADTYKTLSDDRDTIIKSTSATYTTVANAQTNLDTANKTLADMQALNTQGKALADVVTQIKTAETAANNIVTKAQNYLNFSADTLKTLTEYQDTITKLASAIYTTITNAQTNLDAANKTLTDMQALNTQGKAAADAKTTANNQTIQPDAIQMQKTSSVKMQ